MAEEIKLATFEELESQILEPMEKTPGINEQKIDARTGISYYRKTVFLELSDSATSITTGNGVNPIPIQFDIDGWSLSDVLVTNTVKGITGTMDVQVRRARAGAVADMLSTKVTVGDEYFARDGKINPANSQVKVGDQVFIDVDAIHTTPAKGVSVALTFLKITK